MDIYVSKENPLTGEPTALSINSGDNYSMFYLEWTGDAYTVESVDQHMNRLSLEDLTRLLSEVQGSDYIHLELVLEVINAAIKCRHARS